MQNHNRDDVTTKFTYLTSNFLTEGSQSGRHTQEYFQWSEYFVAQWRVKASWQMLVIFSFLNNVGYTFTEWWAHIKKESSSNICMPFKKPQIRICYPTDKRKTLTIFAFRKKINWNESYDHFLFSPLLTMKRTIKHCIASV